MDTSKNCPVCGTRHRVELPHEWTKPNGRPALDLLLTSQSLNIDSGRLEQLFPREDDGQNLIVEAVWTNDREVQLQMRRVPRIDAPGQAVAAQLEPTTKLSRADMLTHAAEIGLKVAGTWTNEVLAANIAKREEALAKQEKSIA